MIIVTLGILLSFTACEKDCSISNDNAGGDVPKEELPSIKVVNQLTDSWRSITEVSLVGYEFNSLNIEPNGGSQTFVLDKGMPGGYENINVKVRFIQASTYIATLSITKDFKNGTITTVTLKGCNSGEGCPGIYLE
jgi:hypothetical protein